MLRLAYVLFVLCKTTALLMTPMLLVLDPKMPAPHAILVII
jgi:hypothetical protein